MIIGGQNLAANKKFLSIKCLFKLCLKVDQVIPSCGGSRVFFGTLFGPLNPAPHCLVGGAAGPLSWRHSGLGPLGDPVIWCR